MKSEWDEDLTLNVDEGTSTAHSLLTSVELLSITPLADLLPIWILIRIHVQIKVCYSNTMQGSFSRCALHGFDILWFSRREGAGVMPLICTFSWSFYTPLIACCDISDIQIFPPVTFLWTSLFHFNDYTIIELYNELCLICHRV